MNNNNSQAVYIISGPAGVGKSTTSTALVKKLSSSAYISGDVVSHMHVKGRKKPWESEEESSLIWTNILSLTKNFTEYGNDVVIDYVTFPLEAAWLKDHLKSYNVTIRYVVLWADNETLMNRDNFRSAEHRMGERCLILKEEFENAELDNKYIFENNHKAINQIDDVIEEIVSNEKYKLV